MVYYLFSYLFPSLFLRIHRKHQKVNCGLKTKLGIGKVYIKIRGQNGGEVG